MNQIIFEGEEKRGRPDLGDVVRIHYTCALQQPQKADTSRSNKGYTGGSRVRKSQENSGSGGGGDVGVVESSRKNRRRPLEFVVGTGQVVKGIDRSIRQMLYGERARVFVTALYAYGDRGYPPLIPPDSALVFDVNLLDFWPRPRWQKPLVQALSEPYTETPYAPRSLEKGGAGGGEVDDASAGGSTGGDQQPRDYPHGKAGGY